MALVRSGLHDAPLQPPPERALVVFGHEWGQRHGFELTDEVSGEIGFLYFHAGARTSKDRDADHLVQHAREHGHEIKKPPRSEQPPKPPKDDRGAWARALEVDGRGVTKEEFLRAHAEPPKASGSRS